MERRIPCALLTVLTTVALGTVAGEATSQCQRRGKPVDPVVRPRGPSRASQDFGNIAVIVDNGLMATPRNPFDLNGRIVRFAPAGSDQFVVSSAPGALEPDYGPPLSFGYPGATEF